VPQGSVLGPLLFTIHINNLDQNVVDANYHFYADDTVMYCCAITLVQEVDLLQKAFNVVQNTDQTKLMWFSNCRRRTEYPFGGHS